MQRHIFQIVFGGNYDQKNLVIKKLDIVFFQLIFPFKFYLKTNYEQK